MRLRSRLDDRHGRLYELPVIIAVAAIAISAGLGRHSLTHGLIALGVGVAVIAALIGATAGLGAAADKASESAGGRSALGAFKAVFWFLFFGAMGGFAVMLVCAFLVNDPAALAIASGSAGLLCGVAGSLFMNRRAPSSETPA